MDSTINHTAFISDFSHTSDSLLLNSEAWLLLLKRLLFIVASCLKKKWSLCIRCREFQLGNSCLYLHGVRGGSWVGDSVTAEISHPWGNLGNSGL